MPRLLLPVLLLALLAPLAPCGDSFAQEAGEWKHKYLAVVVQNSGAQRGGNALALVEMLNRLAAIKPEGVSVGLFGFAEKFRQLEEGRFERKTARLLEDTPSRRALLEAVGELVFHGPSPVYDAVGDALDAAARNSDAALLLVSNAIDNASDLPFDQLARRVEKAGVPIIAFYFPTKPPLSGDSRMRKLAKVSAGRFIDVRVKDSWEQLVDALR